MEQCERPAVARVGFGGRCGVNKGVRRFGQPDFFDTEAAAASAEFLVVAEGDREAADHRRVVQEFRGFREAAVGAWGGARAGERLAGPG